MVGEGRPLDLHALRVARGMNLARTGIAPEVARQVMRNSDDRSTRKQSAELPFADDIEAIEPSAVP